MERLKSSDLHQNNLEQSSSNTLLINIKYKINRLGVSGVMSKQCMDKKVLFQTLDTISQELRKNIWKLKKENQHKFEDRK